MLTNDNRKLADNQLCTNNNNDNNNQVITNDVDNRCVKKFSDFHIQNIRHESTTTTTTSTHINGALNYRDDRDNNNYEVSSPGVAIMSHKNFILAFDATPAQSSMDSTLLSPAEVPFGRRYAEISQFKNHPNVDW
jgi:hypothetical protein